MRPGEREVTLADGRRVSNYSEEWRHECMCRWLLINKPTRTLKHLFLYGVPDRNRLFRFNPKTGKSELVDDYRNLWVDPRSPPLMKHHGIKAADRLLDDARRLRELLNSQPTEKAS